jgi:hypothetical protein
VQSIVTFIKRLTRLCLQSLHCRFIDWTKPDTTSLMLRTLTDLTRRKSKLMAENALLRKPLINLRREVKQPTCTKTDRLLLALLANTVEPGNKACSLSGTMTLIHWYCLEMLPVLCCRCGTVAIQG